MELLSTHAGIGASALIIFFALCGWLFCPLFVLFSSRSQGGAKFGWFLITLFFSWLGFAVFLISTQKPEPLPMAVFRSRTRIDPTL